MPNVTGIELFAGAGGMALGLSQAGIKLEVLIESNKHCCETLRQNNISHGFDWQTLDTDIRELDFCDLTKFNENFPTFFRWWDESFFMILNFIFILIFCYKFVVSSLLSL